MTEERLKEIKDSIDLDYDFCRKYGFEFAKPKRELELYNEVIRLREIIDKAVHYINTHCVNEKISNEVGYKCYTMADTNELEKIINILKENKNEDN